MCNSRPFITKHLNSVKQQLHNRNMNTDINLNGVASTNNRFIVERAGIAAQLLRKRLRYSITDTKYPRDRENKRAYLYRVTSLTRAVNLSSKDRAKNLNGQKAIALLTTMLVANEHCTLDFQSLGAK